MIRVEEVAKKRGISMAQVAIAWTLSKEGGFIHMMTTATLSDWLKRFTVVSAPIVGATTVKNLEDIIGICLLIMCECVFGH